MDERQNAITIAKEYAAAVKAADFPMRINKSYLFGSYAKGTQREDSDIDVAFVVDNCRGNYYSDIVFPVSHLRLKIDDRLEPHIIDPEDDFMDFLKEVQRTGIELV